MAKLQIKHLDVKDNCWIEAHVLDDVISIFVSDGDRLDTSGICVHLDKSTAIRLSKTLRTEINKIVE